MFKLLSFLLFVFLFIACSNLNVENISCSGEKSCPSDYTCNAGTCVKTCDLDCSNNGTCIVKDNKDICLCSQGYIFENNTCEKDYNPECINSDQCTDGVCYDNICVQCVSAQDCLGDNEVCEMNSANPSENYKCKCELGYELDITGSCVSSTCIPQCTTGQECGADGCGGVCGAGCGSGESCKDNLCISIKDIACNNKLCSEDGTTNTQIYGECDLSETDTSSPEPECFCEANYVAKIDNNIFKCIADSDDNCNNACGENGGCKKSNDDVSYCICKLGYKKRFDTEPFSTCMKECLADSNCSVNQYCDSQNNVCLPKWKQVSVGNLHTCAINEDEKLYCWGDNSNKQLGLILASGITYSSSPKLVKTPKPSNPSIILDIKWKSVSAGFDHTCAISKANDLFCWGQGAKGQLGYNYSSAKEVPTIIEEGSSWISVSAGNKYTCGVQNDNKLYCWGDNSSKQLALESIDDGTDIGYSVKLADGSPLSVLDVKTSYNHTCAISKFDSDRGKLYCWGNNSNKKLGMSYDDETLSSPYIVGLDLNWTNISLGYNHTCGITISGTKIISYCWGEDSNKQVGDGDSELLNDKGFNPNKMVLDDNDDEIELHEIYAGVEYSCGIKDNKLYCWGNSSKFQFGAEGNNTPEYAILISENTSDISLNRFNNYHACSIKEGKLYCWGNNNYGQVGSDNNIGETTPIKSLVLITIPQ